MELDELIMLGACALLSDRISPHSQGGYTKPNDEEVAKAVHDAHRVWHAVIAAKHR